MLIARLVDDAFTLVLWCIGRGLLLVLALFVMGGCALLVQPHGVLCEGPNGSTYEVEVRGFSKQCPRHLDPYWTNQQD